jgi:hypothetical protein
VSRMMKFQFIFPLKPLIRNHREVVVWNKVSKNLENSKPNHNRVKIKEKIKPMMMIMMMMMIIIIIIIIIIIM